MTTTISKYSFQISNSVVIHQLHFLPWLPYFAKLASSSAFIVLDNVQYRSRYYQNRTRIRNIDDSLGWLTVPVNASREIICSAVEISQSKYYKKILNRICYCYSKKKFFPEIWSRIQPILENPPSLLNELNIKLIEEVFLILEIDMPTMYFASQLAKSREPTDRMIESCKAIDKDLIVTGWGKSGEIHDIKRMTTNDIHLVKTSPEKTKRIYDITSNEGLFILDVMFNRGSKYARDIICKLADLYK